MATRTVRVDLTARVVFTASVEAGTTAHDEGMTDRELADALKADLAQIIRRNSAPILGDLTIGVIGTVATVGAEPSPAVLDCAPCRARAEAGS